MSRIGQDRRSLRVGPRPWVVAALASLVALGGLTAIAQEPSAPAPAPAATIETAPLVPAPEPQAAPEAPAPAPAAAPAELVGPVPPPPAAAKLEGTGLVQIQEAAALRAEIDERLKALEAPAAATADPAAKLAAKATAEMLAERKARLDDFDKAVKEINDLSSPENNPDRLMAEAKAEADRLTARASQSIDEFLPEVFTKKTSDLDAAARGRMTEAIESARNDVRDIQEKLDATSTEAAKDPKTAQAALRGDRDKIAQRLAALKAKTEAAATAPPPKTPAERKLADDRALNLRLETTVETLGARLVEMKLARADALAEAAALNRRNWIAQVRFGRALLDRMRERHRLLAEADERELKRKADAEEANAQRARDPVERFRAARLAELLEMEARTVTMERELASSPSPSLEEQRGLANRASKEFADVKELFNGQGRLSRLDAIRLNVDYRRIGPERDRIRRDELAQVEQRLNAHANALATVELELIEDAMVDQVGLDNLLDKLPAERHDAVERMAEELEAKHREILTRQRDALKKLGDLSQETLDQVRRRLDILDDQYSYIRTQIFWIRDQEPIGAATFQRGAVEFRRLVKTSIGLARETANPKAWKSPSPAFLALAFLCLVFPLGILRVRLVVKRELARVLPPKPAEVGSALKVDMNPAVR